MQGDVRSFGEIASAFVKNPLGIIALFIVLIYGFASLVTAFGSSLNSSERMPLIYFLVLFPVLVLSVFAWLVSRHSAKLYGPSDYRDEDNYIRMQLAAAASLAAATMRSGSSIEEKDLSEIVSSVRNATIHNLHLDKSSWRNRILWVDDRPENNVYTRGAFEAIGLSFSLALSTNEALDILMHNKFAAIISDMGRQEGPREGYVLLETLRNNGDHTPFFIYAGSNLQEHKLEAQKCGAQGSTNNPQELFQLVTRTIIQQFANQRN